MVSVHHTHINTPSSKIHQERIQVLGLLEFRLIITPITVNLIKVLIKLCICSTCSR